MLMRKETPMKSVKLLLLLILTLSVAVPAFAKGPILDPLPDNLWQPDVRYEYRDQGTWGRTGAGAEGTSGAYFMVGIGVEPGGYLDDYDDVIGIKAKYKGMEPNPEFTLIREAACTDYLGIDVQIWSLYLRPVPWMFQGEWEFIMEYNGSDGKVHSQTVTKVMGHVTFPVKPSCIKFERGGDGFTLSWSGIGNPYPDFDPVDYRIRIYDAGCIAWELIGNWGVGCAGPSCSVAGWYDVWNHRVVFNIPLAWDGYLIQLENRLFAWDQTGRQLSKASQFMGCSDYN
jgi:hypothetical protein